MTPTYRYEGIVAQYSSKTKKHRVEYDDGDIQVVGIFCALNYVSKINLQWIVLSKQKIQC